MITSYLPELELGPWVSGEEPLKGPQLSNALMAEQLKQTWHLLKAFPKTFNARLGQTTLVHHTIQTEPKVVVRETMRSLRPRMWEVIKEEVWAMLELGVSEPL